MGLKKCVDSSAALEETDCGHVRFGHFYFIFLNVVLVGSFGRDTGGSLDFPCPLGETSVDVFGVAGGGG